MADLDYGLIMKALAGVAAGKAIQGAARAKTLKKHVGVVNAGLPVGYQINYDPGRFYFGDPAAAQKALDDLAERQYGQYTSDYYADQAGMQRGPLEAVKTMYTTEVGPVRKEQGVYNVDLGKGRDYLQSIPYLDQYIGQYGQTPGPSQQRGPDMSTEPRRDAQGRGIPELDNGDPVPRGQNGTLTAGAQYGQYAPPDLPADVRVTPEMVNKYWAERTKSRNADTYERGQDLREEEYRDVTKPKSILERRKMELQMKKIEADIANIQQVMQYRPALTKARIAAMARRTGSSPSQLEFLLQHYPAKQVAQALMTKMTSGAGDVGVGGGMAPAPGESGPPGFVSPEEWDAGDDE